MDTKRILLSLLPWVVFSLLAERSGPHAAGLAALVSALVAAVIAVRNRGSAGFKIIDIAGVGCFSVLTVVAYLSASGVDKHIADYGRGGTTMLLGAVMLVSVAFTPFTQQYARETVPREYWDSPLFESINRRLSLAWSMVALVSGIGHLYVGYRLSQGDCPILLRLALNWGVPLLLGLAALGYTRQLAADDDPNTDSAALHESGLPNHPTRR